MTPDRIPRPVRSHGDPETTLAFGEGVDDSPGTGVEAGRGQLFDVALEVVRAEDGRWGIRNARSVADLTRGDVIEILGAFSLWARMLLDRREDPGEDTAVPAAVGGTGDADDG